MLAWVFIYWALVLAFPLDSHVLHERSSAGYTPLVVSCPNRSLIRDANMISPQESEWISGRQAVVEPLVLEWLRDSGLESFDQYYGHTKANIALAFSGGGYRAMLSGAGQLAALDARTEGSTAYGHLGGLLQASTYISGLSGGSWLLTSVVANHWAPVEELKDTQWHLENSMIMPFSSIVQNTVFFVKLYIQVLAKAAAGFDVSLTDIYGRALSQQLYAQDVRDNTWSGIREYPEFTGHQMPFPILVANGVASYTNRVDDTSVIYEFNPFELGSWDHELRKFTDMRYIGSNVVKGVPAPVGGYCVNNFDNIGFLSGTSSTIFNGVTSDQIYNSSAIAATVASGPNLFKRPQISKASSANDFSVSSFRPNPFYDPDGGPLCNKTQLRIADGGEDGENIPIAPFVQSSRKIDVVFAFDNSADAIGSNGGGYPNGSAMVMVANRKNSAFGSQYAFPNVPSTTEFVTYNLTSRPVFFGCDGKQVNADGHPAPLIVYFANTRRSYDSNTPTTRLQYNQTEKNGMIENGYNVATGNNGTISSDWRSCLACAVVLRDQQRKQQSPSDQCARCYEKYCWNG